MIQVVNPSNDQDSSTEKAQAILKKLKIKEEEERASVFARELNLPYIDTNLFPIGEEALRSIKEEEAKKFQVVPIQRVNRKITFASPDPTKPETRNFLEELAKVAGWEIKLFVISPRNFENILGRYKKLVLPSLTDQLEINLEKSDIKEFEKELQDLLDLKQRIKELPTTEILNIIMAGAYKLGASDVHIEPQENSLRLRYRIDGMLHDVVELPFNIVRSILSRIKMMAGMKLNLRDIAQDGTFEIKMEDKKVDVRVSVIPGNFGETLVMRLLDPDSIKVDLENLGLQGLAYEKLKKFIHSSEGMILTTGPTGSGKTTTLYAIINKLNSPDKKIITIEDPIEYEVKGISQTQIERSRGYTFASGLRSIVRQDPDIILVGEVRDDETADIAINSALTGHLVLSTLHTNSAIATIARLIEMGVKPSLITPSINAIIGQRLVRKLCEHCKESYVPAKESVESIKKIISIISPKAKLDIPKKIEKLYRPKGCPKCNNLGYKGRTGIFEIFTINKEIEKLIADMAGKSDLTIAALESGMITMLQDGILKAIQGITTIEEVQRVTGQGNFLEEIYEQLMNQVFARKVLLKKDVMKKIEEASKNLDKVKEVIEKASSKEANKLILASAIILNASDIHLEPKENSVDIRLRIDGILETLANIPIAQYPSLIGEIKILGGIKTETRQGVTDSRFSIKIEGDKEKKEQSVDVRLSIILGGYGETVVMRLLNQGAIALKLDTLGIRKENLDKIVEEVKKPNGIILNTGPTGSGKTTTLYSILSYLNTPDKKIITVEDPIEYQLPGILQTSVSAKKDYTFSTALKSLLRQNPDIMMIGEIRDEETAQIAVQASLTGHLLLSTIHTNSAAGSIQRMLNMNVPATDIAASVNAFMAQRLVRKLCECKKKKKPSSEEKETIQKVLGTLSSKTKKDFSNGHIFEPKGCPKCNGIGYKGRTAVSEVLVINKEIEDLINQGATTSQVEEKAKGNGMITMLQDGILKVLEGETTLEEVERVTEI